MSQHTSALQSFFQPYLEFGRCKPPDLETIKRLNHTSTNNILSLLFDQPAIENIDPFYELYAINHDGSNLHKVIDIFTPPHESHGNVNTIQMSDYQILLHVVAPLSLSMYIKQINTNDHIFLPFGIGMENTKDSHQTMMYIDMINKKAYLMDPNGATNYFDGKYISLTHAHVEFEPLIELLLINYFDQLKQFDINIEFVKRHEWNPHHIGVNRVFNGTKFNFGQCVIFSILLAHIIHNMKCDPIYAYREVYNYNDKQMVKIVNRYTRFICVTCCV